MMTQKLMSIGKRFVPNSIRKAYRKTQTAQVISSFSRPYKVHVGCGKVRLEGWINLDGDKTLSAPDLIWGLSNGLPFEDDSCSFVYSEHVLEHLPVELGVRFLRECKRILEPGGVVRIAMPSLDMLIKMSCNGNWRAQDWLQWPENQFIKSRAEMLNIVFRSWGHQWLYDREELHRRLGEAGFSSIKDVAYHESSIATLRNLETRKDSLLICEADK